MSILLTLINYYNNSTDDDIYHSIIRIILDNLHQVLKMTIYELADLCHVSTTSISRMCKAFDFENYHQFKNDLAESVNNYYFYNRYISVESSAVADRSTSWLLTKYLQDITISVEQLKRLDFTLIDQIIDAIQLKEKIIIYCPKLISRNLPLFQVNLILAGKQTRIASLFQNHQDDLDDRALTIFLIPMMRRSKTLLNLFRSAVQSPALTLLIINTPSAVADESDFSIVFNGHNLTIDNYSFDLIIDMISQAFRQKYIDKF